MKDVRFAFRGLIKRPAFTAIAVITLGLGIGATTAIFSVVNSVMLRRLPYRTADRIVVIQELKDHLHMDALTVMNKPQAEVTAGATCYNRKVIASINEPFMEAWASFSSLTDSAVGSILRSDSRAKSEGSPRISHRSGAPVTRAARSSGAGQAETGNPNQPHPPPTAHSEPTNQPRMNADKR